MHYRTAIVACTPYSPEQKGGVEGGIQYLQKNFIAGETFKDLLDMNRQCREWTDKVNNKVHGTTKRIPSQVLMREERGNLLPLPTEPFSFFNCCERTVATNCHIQFENNYYSVPLSYIGKQVTVRWDDAIIRIVFQGEELALHKRNTGQGIFITVRAHMPLDKVYSETEYKLRHETKMKTIGSNAYQYFIMLVEKQPSYWSQTLRPIYGMVSEYGNEAVDKALGRALAFGALDVRVIRNILEKKLYDIVDSITPVFNDDSNSRELSYYES